MATSTAPTYTLNPTTTELGHSEGSESVYTFSVSVTGIGTVAPPITHIELSPTLQAVATSSINTNGTGTVIIGTSSVYPWTLSFKKIDDNTIITENDNWVAPPNGAVFNYTKHLTPPSLTIDVYAGIPDIETGTTTTIHQQYSVTATPNFSAGRDQLVALAHASPV
jgi:hypothetical protein